MINSNSMSSKASSNIPQWLVIVFAVATLAGFVDASYLTAEHIRGSIPPCTLTGGCEQVLTSAYASVAGVPVSVMGMLYYGALLVSVIAFFDTGDRRILHRACWLAVAGFLASLYFVYVQVFVIHALCLYCLISAVSSLVLAAVGTRIMRVD